MKILITGSNGLLGQKLLHKLRVDDSVELLATSKGDNRVSEKNGYTYFDLDITNKEAVSQLIAAEKPSVVINTAALTNVDLCEQQKEACDDLNVNAVRYLVDACEKIDSHLIHISTDFIFDGEDGPYTEEDEPNPISYYGLSKLKSENIIKKSKLHQFRIGYLLVS